MNLQDFQLAPAHLSDERDRRALDEMLQTVFASEPGVTQSIPPAAGDADTNARYILARDQAGRAIGCGRLSAGHTLGQLAVLPEWRGKGVGRALLQALIEQARGMGWAELRLAALASTTGFYARDGFAAEGAAFEAAGLPHQAMRLALPPRQPPASPPAPTRHALPAGSPDQLDAARLQLLQRARRRLSLCLPRLESHLLSSHAEMAELRRIATSGRGAEIRVLLFQPEQALRDGHRLILLMQRLSSVVRVRCPVDEVDLASNASCLINDDGGYLFQPDAGVAQGRAALDDRATAAPLQQHFDQMWERAAPASVLQPLDL